MKSKIFFSLLIIGTGVLSVKAQKWSPVGLGINGNTPNTTWSLCADDSMLFAGGRFSKAGDIDADNIAQWDGKRWNSVGSCSKGFISEMAVYKGNLYAGGEFTMMGGAKARDIAMWNGAYWSPVGKGIIDHEWGVYTMAVYKDILYVGGAFDTVGGKRMDLIAAWNGTDWSKVGKGIYAADEDDGVFALAVYNNELYVAGGLDSTGGIAVNNIAKWDGTKWSTVGEGINGTVHSMTVYNGKLYVAGQFDSAGGVPTKNIAMWNGTKWSALGSGVSGKIKTYISSLAVYNDELYVGGNFDTVDNHIPINCIARWNGSKWSPVGSSGINIGGAIDAMAVFKNSLYVGGGFDSVSGIYAKNIAKWTSDVEMKKLSGKK
ncbi:MAG: hypothetical protein ACLQQ4_18935 [Bacteroidia bacterium]